MAENKTVVPSESVVPGAAIEGSPKATKKTKRAAKKATKVAAKVAKKDMRVAKKTAKKKKK